MIYALRTRNEIPFHSAIHLYKSSSSFVPVCMGVDKLLPFGICNSYFANGQDAVAYKSTIWHVVLFFAVGGYINFSLLLIAFDYPLIMTAKWFQN